MISVCGISSEIDEHISICTELKSQETVIRIIADLFVQTLLNGGKVLLCGNGGSAADAQHIAAELVVRFQRDRRALPAMSLSTDSSILTAISNDFSYESLFVRQAQAFATDKDLIVLLSTSGNSSNLVQLALWANENKINMVGFLGCTGGRVLQYLSYYLLVPSSNTPRIQEMHILIAHIICNIVDHRLSVKS